MGKTFFKHWMAHKTAAVAEEKNLKYETRLIVLKMNEHLSDELLQLNPRGELPILTDSQFSAVLHEEPAMLQFVEQFYADPEARLMPDPNVDKKAYTDVLVLFHEVVGPYTNALRQLIYQLISKPDGTIDMTVIPQLREGVMKELPRWEKQLSRGNQFLCGEFMTLADIAFFPFLAHLDRWGFPLNKFPSVQRYYNNFAERPAVKKTWPSGWSTVQVKPVLKQYIKIHH